MYARRLLPGVAVVNLLVDSDSDSSSLDSTTTELNRRDKRKITAKIEYLETDFFFLVRDWMEFQLVYCRSEKDVNTWCFCLAGVFFFSCRS